MKRLFFILILPLLVSCSKEDEPEVFTQDDLIGTWQIHSINGNAELDECDLNTQIRFTQDLMHRTGAYYNDFEKTDCKVFTSEFKYQLEDRSIRIESQSISYTGYVQSDNSIKISSTSDAGSNTYIYKR